MRIAGELAIGKWRIGNRRIGSWRNWLISRSSFFTSCWLFHHFFNFFTTLAFSLLFIFFTSFHLFHHFSSFSPLLLFHHLVTSFGCSARPLLQLDRSRGGGLWRPHVERRSLVGGTLLFRRSRNTRRRSQRQKQSLLPDAVDVLRHLVFLLGGLWTEFSETIGVSVIFGLAPFGHLHFVLELL